MKWPTICPSMMPVKTTSKKTYPPDVVVPLRDQLEHAVDHGMAEPERRGGKRVEDGRVDVGVVLGGFGHDEVVSPHEVDAQDAGQELAVDDVLHDGGDQPAGLLIEDFVVVFVPLRQVSLQQFGDSVVFPHEDHVHHGQERVLVDPHVAGHEVLGSLRSKQVGVGANLQLLAGRQLIRPRVPLQPAVDVRPQGGRVLLLAAVNDRAVDEGRDLVELLPDAVVTHRRRSEEVQALGGVVHPAEEPVRTGDGDGEAFAALHAESAAIRLVVLGAEGDVVVQELAELHHHVGESRVRHVVVRVVPLRDPSGVGQRRGVSAAPGFARAVRVFGLDDPFERGAGGAPFGVLQVVATAGNGAVAIPTVARGRFRSGPRFVKAS